ncbi:type II toxin-antitoxin system Phd/YefM family antitoxin [Brevundimonas sp. NPDC092305]|uniref:type II toxin-antitoxin system Phd/YefM family antitoxin n=1 Tax=Brevundimonas sp. NPDC092305 TaxID=3363957 RepID=UPI0038172244
MTSLEISATEFKATCLELLDRLADHRIDRLVVTKRGRPVAVLTPPPGGKDRVAGLFGFMRGAAVIPRSLDLVAPVSTDAFNAEDGWAK